MNSGLDADGEDEDGAALGNFYAYRNTFDGDSVWVDVPKDGELKFT